MPKPRVSPLHMVIDARRWDAEPPLGRLVIVAHAAFLDAGFVPHGTKVPKSARLPKQVGRTASTLFLRYTAPQLLHRPDVEPAALRLCAHGRHVVFYTRFHVWWWLRRPEETYWVCLDALAAAPLLSGRLDDTGRALRNDARVSALWKALSEGLCRRLLIDMCCSYGEALEPTFMSLPGDIKAAILGRLTDGEDLARVERTCTELRRLVAEHDDEFWKPRFEALTESAASFYLPDDEDDGAGTGDSEVSSWKARYMRAKRTSSWGHRFFFSPSWSRFLEPIHYDMAIPMLERDRIMGRSHWLLPTEHIWSTSTDRCDPQERRQAADAVTGWMRRRAMTWKERYMTARRRTLYRHTPRLPVNGSILWWRDSFVRFGSDYRSDSPELPAETAPRLRRRTEAPRGKCAAGHGQTVVSSGHNKRRHGGGGGATHSPSSRFRWKHR